MYNKVILLGRITQNLELKTTPSGVSVLTFSIAVDRRFQQKDEEKKSDFFNCVAWRNEAEFISKYWSKGRAILVEGELQNRSYVDKNGVTRYVTEIIVDRASFTGESKANSDTAKKAYDTPPVPSSVPSETSMSGGQETSSTDEDYPF